MKFLFFLRETFYIYLFTVFGLFSHKFCSHRTQIRWNFISDVDPDPPYERPPGSGSPLQPMRIPTGITDPAAVKHLALI